MESVKIDMTSDGIVDLWYEYLKVWKFDYFYTQNCEIISEEVGRDKFEDTYQPYSLKRFRECLKDESYIMRTDVVSNYEKMEEFKFCDVYGKK